MALQSKIKIIPGRKVGLNHIASSNAPQASAATFKQGAPVKLASGALTAPSTVNSGTGSAFTFVKVSSTANVVGFAMGTAVASSTASMPYAKIAEGQEFIGNLIHTTQSSAKVSKIGSTVYLGKVKSSDTHWGWMLDSTSVSSAASMVQGKITHLIDPASTVNGRVAVTITKGGGLFV